jgi:hypothetical protein
VASDPERDKVLSQRPADQVGNVGHKLESLLERYDRHGVVGVIALQHGVE